jgi:hypothetical protein
MSARQEAEHMRELLTAPDEWNVICRDPVIERLSGSWRALWWRRLTKGMNQRQCSPIRDHIQLTAQDIGTLLKLRDRSPMVTHRDIEPDKLTMDVFPQRIAPGSFTKLAGRLMEAA